VLTAIPVLADEWLKARPADPLLATGVLLGVIAVPLIVRVGIAIQAARSRRLREQFGSEYDETLLLHEGDVRRAERALRNRTPPSP
jgi:hypothetical protein